MNFARYLTYLREKAEITKVELADKIGFTSTYVSNLEHERNRPPEFDICQKIITVLTKDESEINKFFELAYIERQKDSDIAFQNFLVSKINPTNEQKALRTLRDHGIHADHINQLEEPPLISLTHLYKKGILSNFKHKGGNMLRIKVDDLDNDPKFEKEDILTIDCEQSRLEDGRFYAVRDGKLKRVIFRQVKIYGESIVLRTANMRLEETFNHNQFEIIGKIIKCSRERYL
jgi:transcriptional regulator with XRE-family HTH domain